MNKLITVIQKSVSFISDYFIDIYYFTYRTFILLSTYQKNHAEIVQEMKFNEKKRTDIMQQPLVWILERSLVFM